MPLVLQPAVDADAMRIAEIERLAFASNRLSPVLFPGPFPPDAAEKRAASLVTQRREDPTVRWMKVVDTETDELCAFAKWDIMETPKEVRRTRQFGPGCNLEACEEFFGGIGRKRSELMGGKAYCCTGPVISLPFSSHLISLWQLLTSIHSTRHPSDRS